MKKVEILRIETSEGGTRGVMRVDGNALCVTLERPWLDNRASVSCIPAGTYKCKRIISPTRGKVFQVLDVPGRTHILIHSGNTIKDTEGCILPGSKFGELQGLPAVLASGVAYALFMQTMHRVDEFTLTISDHY